MKKTLFVFAALVMLATSASAQFSNGGKKSSSRSDSSNGAVGVNVLYGTEVGSVGFGAKFQVNIIQALRAEGEFDYFLKKDYYSAWNASVNFHYQFTVANGLRVYPLAGVTYMRVISHFETSAISSYSSAPNPLNYSSLASYQAALENYLRGGESSSTTSSDGHFGANLGAGIEYDLSDSWKIGFETKYQIIGKGSSQVAFTVGAAYKF